MTYEVDYQSGTMHFKEDRPEAFKCAQWYTVTGRSSWAKVYEVDDGAQRKLIMAFDPAGNGVSVVEPAALVPVAVPGTRSRLSDLAERVYA
jgi:hypothetical protein